MIHRKIAKHFLPHYFVDPEFAEAYEGRGRGHHRAHALSLWSLFSYLQILIIFGASLYLIRANAPQILGQITFGAEQIITLTNNKRAEFGLPTLSNNALLAQAAAGKAGDMFAGNYWAHNSPGGKTPWQFMTAAGYRYVFAGENLARDFEDANSVVNAWMNSPSHRANVLDKNFKEIGVAVSSGTLGGNEGILVVQMFGTSIAPTFAGESQQNAAGANTSTAEVPSPSPKKQLAQVPNQQEATGAPPQVSQISEIVTSAESQPVLATKKFSIAKAGSLALVSFIFALLVIEVITCARRAHVSLRSGVLAHLTILAFVLIALWYATAGAIL